MQRTPGSAQERPKFCCFHGIGPSEPNPEAPPRGPAVDDEIFPGSRRRKSGGRFPPLGYYLHSSLSPRCRARRQVGNRRKACLSPTAERARRGAMNHRRPLRVTQLALARVHAASGDASDRDDEGKFASESYMPSVRPSGGARLSGHNCEMSVSAR